MCDFLIVQVKSKTVFITILILTIIIANATIAQINYSSITKYGKDKFREKNSLCQPNYDFGCVDNDGFSDFAVEQIQNYGSGCADNTGLPGWSEYYDLGPASFIPGTSYSFYLASNYYNQHVNIWIDFNDDLMLTSNEIILNNYIITVAGVLNTVDLTIPGNAPQGLHLMRAMAVWPNAFSDPCGSYLYGEAEDYTILIAGGAYGNLEGFVTEVSGGMPIEGASINIGGFISGSSGSDGYYYIEHVLSGSWEVNCLKDGYNMVTSFITIEEDLTATKNFQMTQPQILINPLNISVSLDPNQLVDEQINISNPGNGELEWSANINFIVDGETDELFDVFFEWPLGPGTGEAGIESDGNWIYTSKWDGSAFYRYDLNGNIIGQFTCGNATGVRDLAYDGTYFYGAAANSTVFQMDFDNEVVVSQFTAPTDIRAIAYNEEENVFYGNNFNTDITKFNTSGVNLGSFPVGPVGSSYYGFAVDNFSDGAPYLWGYAQTGATLNELVQIQLPSGVETGLTLDVGSVLPVGSGIAGGLAISDQIINGHYIFLGVSQMTSIWGIDLCTSGPVWLTIEPDQGFLSATQNEDLTLYFNSADLIPGVYNAEIQFSSNPNVGSPLANITLHVEGLVPPINLLTQVVCTNIHLFWQMPSGGNPDSWNVYRNGALLENVITMSFDDEMLIPGLEYNYYIKAVYAGEESQPTEVKSMILPTPSDLEPLNPSASYQGNNSVLIAWDAPDGCLEAESFHIYRDGAMIGTATSFEYTDADAPYGYHNYFVRSQYYFGESGNSIPANVFVGIEEMTDYDGFRIFPNPASNQVIIASPMEVNRVKLFDNNGHLVMDIQMNTMQFRIDISKLDSGIYFIKLGTAEGEILKKITVN